IVADGATAPEAHALPAFFAERAVRDGPACAAFRRGGRQLYAPLVFEDGAAALDGAPFFAPTGEEPLAPAAPWTYGSLATHLPGPGPVDVVLYARARYSREADGLRRHEVRRETSRAYAAVFGGGAPEDAPADLVAIAGAADATQRRAISRIVAGASLVLRGPPGTGKSSTLANACVALAAAGRTVLVVGQEAAAARVVAAKVAKLVGEDGGAFVVGPDELADRKRKPRDGAVEAAVRRAREASLLPPDSFARRVADDRGLAVSSSRVDDDWGRYCVVLEKDSKKAERRFVCELCGREAASEGPIVKHLAKHRSDLAKRPTAGKKLAEYEALDARRGALDAA
ncbi:hypothetical protein AURANDRAFT_69549, partial [Aureococcus anophagefferens]